MTHLITSRTDWTPKILEEIWLHIEDIGLNDLKFDINPNEFRICSAEQMLDAYASVGLPVNYNHWSFGKEYIKSATEYNKGRKNLAYEMVINTVPTVNYLMEENDAVTQALVMAHAGIGHNFVFKNNYMFKEWTSPGSILDYMVFARDYIIDCEEKYGVDEVEFLLDAAHALSSHAVDKRKKKHKRKLSDEEKSAKLIKDEDEQQQYLDHILQTTSMDKGDIINEQTEEDYEVDEENLLYFIYKNSPNLQTWQREILRISYKINQYYYPQRQDQCVTGENLVSTGKGLLRLDEIISKEGHLPSSGINLLTHGDKFTSISHTYLNRSAKVLKVKTATGREYTATPEHPLMSLKGLTHETVQIRDLNIGDHLVLNTNYVNMFSDEYVQLKDQALSALAKCTICGFESTYLPSHLHAHKIDVSEYDQDITSEQHRANKSVNYPTKFPSILNEELSELLGYWDRLNYPITTMDHSRFRWTGSLRVAGRLEYLLKSLFGIEVNSTYILDSDWQVEHSSATHRINFSSWGLRKFFNDNFGTDDSYTLEENGVWKEIRTSPKSVIISYLRALFDGHALNRIDVGKFYMPCLYENKLKHIQILLGSLGIISIISQKPGYTKNLRIAPDFREQFSEVIGSRLDLLCSNNTEVNGPYSSCIPGAKALLEQIIDHVKISKKEHFSSFDASMAYSKKVKDKKLWSQQDLPNSLALPQVRASEITTLDLIKRKEEFDLALDVPCKAATDLKKLLKISDGCFYDRVVSIEEVSEDMPVYDVTVPENHLFWMSGMISHNTVHEGCATFTHFYIMSELENKGLISPDAQLAWLSMHSGVVFQPELGSKYYQGESFNPYALGFDILKEIRRICDKPTKEDEEWFPWLVGKDWRTEIKTAVTDFRDESLIEQYLSPALMRKYKMMSVGIYDDIGIVEEIADDKGYGEMRRTLASHYALVHRVPEIAVKGAKMKGDRKLVLEYRPYQGRSMHAPNAKKVLSYIRHLWGYDVELGMTISDGKWKTLFTAG